MWQSSNTIRAGHMHHIALCCLEDTTEATPSDNDIRYDIRRPEGMTWME